MKEKWSGKQEDKAAKNDGATKDEKGHPSKVDPKQVEKPAAASHSPEPEHKADPEAKHAEGEHPTEPADIDSEYTPRQRELVDEESCDEVAKETLEKVRQMKKAWSQRLQDLDAREGALKNREASHAKISQNLEERIKELGRLSGDLNQKLVAVSNSPAAEPEKPSDQREPTRVTSDTDRKERIKRVTQMVASMPPQRAAAILGSYKEDELAVEVLENLPQEVAGKVLAQMRPDSAAKLTEKIGNGAQSQKKAGALRENQ